MTRVNKNFTLSLEIVQKLGEIDNASALIDRLLTEHFALNSQKKKNLTEKYTNQLKNYSKAVKNLKKNLKIINFFDEKGIDARAVRWLLGHDELPSVLETVNYLNGRELKIKSKDFQECWEIVNKNRDVLAEM